MKNEYSELNGLVKTLQLYDIWLYVPVWLNGRVFLYELSSCGFESRCSHLNCNHIKLKCAGKRKVSSVGLKHLGQYQMNC